MTHALRALHVAHLVEAYEPDELGLLVFELSQRSRQLGARVSVISAQAPPRAWLEAQTPAGLSVHALPRSTTLGTTQLAQLLRHIQADVLHTHELDVASWGAHSATIAGVPHLHSDHVQAHDDPTRARFLQAKASATSLTTTSRQPSALPRDARRVHLPHGLSSPTRDLDQRHATRARHHIDPQEVVLGWSGAPGAPALMQALHEALRAMPTLRVLALGSTTSRRLMGAWALRAKLTTRVHVAALDELPQTLYPAMDLFLAHDQSAMQELAALRAMSYGAPVLWLKESPPQAPTQAMSLALDQVDRPEALMGALLTASSQLRDRQRCGQAARSFVATTHDLGKVAARVQELYVELTTPPAKG